jgi:LuxR family maltose regulon positive regulatory protein
VALQLAAMSVKDRSDPERFVEQLSGAQTDVGAYLLENVFQAQPAPIQDFLLRTSILDRMSAPLCNALTGRDDAQLVLERLEHSQLLIFRLDRDHTWYRYHHLFSAFLTARLAAQYASDVPDLHERASRWFEDRGNLGEAVHYAIGGGLLHRATALMPALGRELFARGAFKELLHWLERIPDEMLQERAELCSLHAWALAYLGELELARQRMADAHAALESPDMPEPAATRRSIEAELQVLRTAIGVIETDEPDVSDLQPDVARLIPIDYPAMRGFAHVALGYAARADGRLSESLEHYRRGAQTAKGGDSSLVHMLAQFNVGTVLYLMGQPRDAETSMRRALAVASERRWLRAMSSAFLRVQLSVVLYEQNMLRDALLENSEALAVLKSTRAFGFMGIGLVERARILLALGRREEATAYLDRALALARRHGVRRVIFRARLLAARMALTAGSPERAEIELEQAEASLEPKELTRRDPLSEKHEALLIERVRASICCRRYGVALRAARDGLKSATRAEHGRNKIELLALQALAWQGLAQTDRALNKLDQALALADERGFVRLFVDCGRDMGALLRLLVGETRQASEAQRILDAFDDREGRIGRSARSRARSESALHYREEQILRLISLGLRNRDIAARLDLSEETVKWYLKRLYDKLGVRTRTQAVAVAREMAIIS